MASGYRLWDKHGARAGYSAGSLDVMCVCVCFVCVAMARTEIYFVASFVDETSLLNVQHKCCFTLSQSRLALNERRTKTITTLTCLRFLLRPAQAFGNVAAGLGLKHSDKLIFGTLNGVKLAGFAETFNVYQGLPRLVVLVGYIFLFALFLSSRFWSLFLSSSFGVPSLSIGGLLWSLCVASHIMVVAIIREEGGRGMGGNIIMMCVSSRLVLFCYGCFPSINDAALSYHLPPFTLSGYAPGHLLRGGVNETRRSRNGSVPGRRFVRYCDSSPSVAL